MTLKRIRRPDRLTVMALASVAALATAAGIAQATGVAMFRGKAITYSERHFEARPLDLAVFKQTPTARDRAAARDARVLASIEGLTAHEPNVPAEWLPGEARPGAIRTPLVGLGPGERTIYLVRTTRGRVCAGLTGFSSGCLAGLPPDVPATLHVADPDASGLGEPALIWGVARDSVRRIDVIVDGASRQAALEGNAYFFQLADPSMSSRSIEAIVVHLASGDSVRVAADHGPEPGAPVAVVTGGPPNG
jgi:hypothetical protein